MPTPTLSIKTLLPFDPCKTGWDNFLETFNNPEPDRQFTIPELLDAGIPVPDVIWALRALPDSAIPLIREFALRCAERVLPVFEARFPDDKRPRIALETARAFLVGTATLETLVAAKQNAYTTDAYATAAYAADAAANATANAANAAANATAAYAAYAAYAAANAAAYATAYAAAAADREAQAQDLRSLFS